MAAENRTQGMEAPHLLTTTWSAFKNALIHPIPLPIICGLLFAQTGWTLPVVVDKPLALLGSAFGPIALVLVGVTMATTQMRGHLQRRAVDRCLEEPVVAIDGGHQCLDFWPHRLAPDRDGGCRRHAHGRECVHVRAALRSGPGTHHGQHGALDRVGAVHTLAGDAGDVLGELAHSGAAAARGWAKTLLTDLARLFDLVFEVALNAKRQAAHEGDGAHEQGQHEGADGEPVGRA